MNLLLHTVFVLIFFLVDVIEVNTKPTNKNENAVQKFLKSKQNLWEQSGQFQGDIIVKKHLDRNAISTQTGYWPNKELPYEISEGFTPANKEVIKKSLDYIRNKTCIKPRPRVGTDSGSIFISHERGQGCSSNIGYWNTRQYVYLDQILGCVQFGVIVHELLHVIGLWHQQSAHNRDKYLDIIWDNVKKGMEHNFDKAPNDTSSFGYKYDFNSIMHYTPYAFSKNGNATIIPKDKNEGVHMGQRQRLSRIDIAKIKTMYNCE